jgi:hypothetical protein
VPDQGPVHVTTIEEFIGSLSCAGQRVVAMLIEQKFRGAVNVRIVDRAFTFSGPCSHSRILVLQRGEELPYLSASGM